MTLGYSSLQSAWSAAPQTVVQAVQKASARTGVDFSYLMNKAGQESSFKADAKAKTSSATGLYQFIEKTWLKMVKEHGADYGLGNYAAKINDDLTVKDSASKTEILNLRKDANVSALMAAEFTRENKDHLQEKVGGKIGQTELYMAHFMGAGGASKFLNALKANPDRAGASIFPTEAAANKGVFYGKEGQSLSLQQIYNRFAAKFKESSPVVQPIDDRDMPTEMSIAGAAYAQDAITAAKTGFSLARVSSLVNFLNDDANSAIVPSHPQSTLPQSVKSLNTIYNQNVAQNYAFLTSLVTAQMDNVLHRDKTERQQNNSSMFENRASSAL